MKGPRTRSKAVEQARGCVATKTGLFDMVTADQTDTSFSVAGSLDFQLEWQIPRVSFQIEYIARAV